MISEVDYSHRASDTWRWIDEAADTSITTFISRLANRGPAHRPSGVGADDQRKLLIYAQRRSFGALRHNDPGMVRDAAIAVSLVTEDGVGDDRVIWWTVAVVCYAHRRVGGVDAPGVDAWIAGADQTVRVAFSRMLDDAGAGLDTFDPSLREMVTRAGTVLLGDRHRPFAPTVDLVDIAYRVADLLEADRYHVEAIDVADAFYLFPWDHVGDGDVVEADRRRVGAVRVTAVVDGQRYQPIEVFLIEFLSGQDTALVAAAADRWDNDEEIQIAVAEGKVLALLCVRYRERPFTETLVDLERFRAGLSAAFGRQSQARSPHQQTRERTDTS